MEIEIIDAGDVVKKRLFDYLNERLKGENDNTRWEFFNYLLEKAKDHRLDYSGYGSFYYQKDRNEARAICKQREANRKQEVHLPERRTGRRF